VTGIGFLITGVRSGEVSSMSLKGRTRCREITDVLESEGLLGELHAPGISVVSRHKQVR
jgi:hypothetical protein